MAFAFDVNQTFFRGINMYKRLQYPFIEKKRGQGLREGRKMIANQSFYFRNNWWLLTNRSKAVMTKDVQYERKDYSTIKMVNASCEYKKG